MGIFPLHWEKARDGRAREEAYRFRYERYFAARERLPGTDHEGRRVFLPHDARSAHYLARSAHGKLVAVGTATPAAEPSVWEEWRDLFDLERLEPLAPWLVLISRVIVEEESRGSSLFGQVCLYLAERCVEAGFHYAAHYCAPGLVFLYERLGYRLYGKGGNLSGGPFRLPMLLVIDDTAYMRRIRSPFRVMGLDKAEQRAWVDKASAVCPELDRLPLCALKETERARRLVALCPALREAGADRLRRLGRGALVPLEQGDALAPEGTDEGTFFLLSGALRAGEKTVPAGAEVRTGGAAVIAEEPSLILAVNHGGKR